MKELTKAEEEVMQILWKLKEGIVKQILEKMPGDPKPAYNTVSTVVRVLETKGFVDHKAYGNSHVYFPIVSEEDYKKFAFDKVIKSYFNNSYKSLVSYLVKEQKLNLSELAELILLAERSRKKTNNDE
ncbi:BlaI/MecI/CopY family transcriptional regulator [Mucilaginibacter daejeonensis]|uniref:BlaI/MecI/CopY family transcriptional regulator n=1 Tax=Mucilaginibacter daejeonensis TaxID=398049 RepID=UPI001D179A49|nr:BlaI/MecI/CopY family transcriptional regulator [Mucilaginibacter daejeonensis]UEG52338.1 BlaI/MecI/CopY family transcriptional regulator [Mucilaginibacter daejeonensis]